jgi:hypothetical protein
MLFAFTTMKEASSLSKWSASLWPTSNTPYGNLPINHQHHINGEELRSFSTQPSNDLNNGYLLCVLVVWSTAFRKFDILLNEVVSLRFRPVCTKRNWHFCTFFILPYNGLNRTNILAYGPHGLVTFSSPVLVTRLKQKILYLHVAITAMSFLLSCTAGCTWRQRRGQIPKQ